MLPDDLESVAARHVPGAGPLDITRLCCGLVNRTYKVLRGGAAFAMRVAAADPHHLGIDRDWEARLLQNAAAADLAPAPVYCDPERGILISRWTDGRPWSPQDARQPLNIRRMAVLLRRVHALQIPAPPRLMSPADWIERYSAADGHAAGAPCDAAGAPCDAADTARGAADTARGAAVTLRAAAAVQLAALATLPGVEPLICHSDLHALNLIDRGHSLILLDWEYAHVADPLWDLAAWSANNDFEPRLQQALLQGYAGRPPTRDEESRLRRLAWLYDYVCLLWSELYLCQRGDGARNDGVRGAGGQGDAARAGVAARARLLAARLA